MSDMNKSDFRAVGLCVPVVTRLNNELNSSSLMDESDLLYTNLILSALSGFAILKDPLYIAWIIISRRGALQPTVRLIYRKRLTSSY